MPGILFRFFRVLQKRPFYYLAVGSIILFCSIFISIVIDSWVLHPQRRPQLFAITDIQQHSLVAVATYTKPTQPCFAWVSLWPPSYRVVCSLKASYAHQLYLRGLEPGSMHILFVGRGFRWWRSYKLEGEPVKTVDPIKTLPKAIQTDQDTAVLLLGKVSDVAGLGQSNALLVVTAGGTRRMFSTRTNTNGRYAMRVPVSELISEKSEEPSMDELKIQVWLDNGLFTTITQRASLVDGKPQTIFVRSL